MTPEIRISKALDKPYREIRIYVENPAFGPIFVLMLRK